MNRRKTRHDPVTMVVLGEPGSGLVEPPMNLLLDTVPFPRLAPCSGPLIWFDSAPIPCVGHEHAGAVLECAGCGSWFTTGNYLDHAHAETPVLRSPL